MRTVFLLAIPLLVGCGAPYHFVAQAAPNPFVRPGCRAMIEPIHVDQLVVGEKPVVQYRGEKSDNGAMSFDDDVRASDAIFHERIADEHGSIFMPGTPDNTFLIRPVFTHWEPGFYAVFASAPGRANLVVDVLAPSGQTLDRITIETKASDFSSGGRMRAALKSAGHAVARYISDNWVCAAQ